MHIFRTFSLERRPYRASKSQPLIPETNKTVEVKRDAISHLTGNAFIETRCNGTESGLNITTKRIIKSNHLLLLYLFYASVIISFTRVITMLCSTTLAFLDGHYLFNGFFWSARFLKGDREVYWIFRIAHLKLQF